MPPATNLLSACEAMMALGTTEAGAEVTRELRSVYEQRCGSFGPEDPWFEPRSRAFWDDALTTQRFGRRMEAAVGTAVLPWLVPLERAHRGLFRAAGEEREAAGRRWLIEDVWGGACFSVEAADPGLAAALAASSSFFDGRVVGALDPFSVTLLPGAVFHPEDATEPIERVLAAARAAQLPTGRTLDALLRMERNLRSHSRVKPAYAYRADHLRA